MIINNTGYGSILWSILEYHVNFMVHECSNHSVPWYASKYHGITIWYHLCTKALLCNGRTSDENWKMKPFEMLYMNPNALFSIWDVCVYLCLHYWCWFQLAGFNRSVSDSSVADLLVPLRMAWTGHAFWWLYIVILLNGWHLHNNR